jgi:hypothetical protein
MMRDRKYRQAVLGAAVLVLVAHAGVALAATDDVEDARHDSTLKHADADFELERAKCKEMSGDAMDICLADAEARHVSTRSAADAQREGTPEATADARKARADAQLDAAEARCDVLQGNDKDVCMKRAELGHVEATAGADAEQTKAEANEERRDEVSDARRDLAEEKCDSLAGAAQDACEARAERGGR